MFVDYFYYLKERLPVSIIELSVFLYNTLEINIKIWATDNYLNLSNHTIQ